MKRYATRMHTGPGVPTTHDSKCSARSPRLTLFSFFFIYYYIFFSLFAINNTTTCVCAYNVSRFIVRTRAIGKESSIKKKKKIKNSKSWRGSTELKPQETRIFFFWICIFFLSSHSGWVWPCADYVYSVQ